MIVYVSIGNSDDKLSQQEWSRFYGSVSVELSSAARSVHGQWQSLPSSPFQNACWCIEVSNSDAAGLKALLAEIAKEFEQDSIAWAEAPVTEFIESI